MVARQQICQDGTAKAATDDCDAQGLCCHQMSVRTE
jgi:hypothetical protein